MQSLFSPQFREIPKVELHRHLDCSMRWSTFSELAPFLGLPWPDSGERRGQYLITQPMKDLDSVLRKFLSSQKVLASEEILTRLAFEACEDAYNEGILLLELRYAPSYISQGHSHLTYEKILQAFQKGIALAEKKFPMAVGLICILQRQLPAEELARVCDFAIDHRSEYIALDLADSEEGFEPRKFSSLFNKAKASGLHITIHSGEAPHPQAGQRVMDSIDWLGAERIGHGVQIAHHPSVLERVVRDQIPLEVCPISNWLTQAFPTHETHPFRPLMEAGVAVTINSDDPGIFATTLNDDYEVLHRIHGLTSKEFEILNDRAAFHSFIPFEKRKKLWPRELKEKVSSR